MTTEAKSRASIKEQNIQDISEAWNSLSPKLRVSDMGIFGRSTFPTQSEDFLALSAIPGRERKYIYHASTDFVRPSSGLLLARRDYWFYPDEDGVIVVRSESSTPQAQESRGYGSGLILINNQVIDRMIELVPELQDKTVVSGIFDDAHGQEGNLRTIAERAGWTTHFAKQLGYLFHEELGIWIKTVRDNGKPYSLDELIYLEQEPREGSIGYR